MISREMTHYIHWIDEEGRRPNDGLSVALAADVAVVAVDDVHDSVVNKEARPLAYHNALIVLSFGKE